MQHYLIVHSGGHGGDLSNNRLFPPIALEQMILPSASFFAEYPDSWISYAVSSMTSKAKTDAFSLMAVARDHRLGYRR
jgi:hypothetical protein